MKKNRIIKTVITLMTIVAVAGFATYSFAGYHGGCQWSAQNPCPARAGKMANLTDEQVQKLDEERQAFWNETADLRQQINAKQAELVAEISGQTPDEDKAKAIQKEISDLEAQLDQQRVSHMIKMQGIAPGFCGGGKGMGCWQRMCSGFQGKGCGWQRKQ